MLGWPGGPGCIGLTLLVMVRQWLRLEMGKALSGHQLAWWRRHRWLGELSGSSLRLGHDLVVEAVVSALG